jgi:hypothetical protein
MSINDNLPSGNPSGRSLLIGLGCVMGALALFMAYYKIIGF